MKFQYEYDPNENEWKVMYDGEFVCTVGAEWLLEYCGDSYTELREALDRLIGERIVDFLNRDGSFMSRYFVRRALFE